MMWKSFVTTHCAMFVLCILPYPPRAHLSTVSRRFVHAPGKCTRVGVTCGRHGLMGFSIPIESLLLSSSGPLLYH